MSGCLISWWMRPRSGTSLWVESMRSCFCRDWFQKFQLMKIQWGKRKSCFFPSVGIQVNTYMINSRDKSDPWKHQTWQPFQNWFLGPRDNSTLQNICLFGKNGLEPGRFHSPEMICFASDVFFIFVLFLWSLLDHSWYFRGHKNTWIVCEIHRFRLMLRYCITHQNLDTSTTYCDCFMTCSSLRTKQGLNKD